MILEVTLCILAILLLRRWLSTPKGLPPGPFVYPVIGSGMIDKFDQVQEYHNKYGDIFRTEIGNLRMVYICDFKLFKEVMNKSELADRPNFELFNFLTEGKEAGVIFSNGQRWTNARRFLLRNLRDLGMGKSFLDAAIIREAEHLVEDFKKSTGKPITFPVSLNVAVLNVVWQMVASRRYDLHDKEVHEFMELIKRLQEDTTPLMILDMIPILRTILPQIVLNKVFGMENAKNTRETAKKLFGEVFERRRADMDPSHAENVIDQYLIQMKEQPDIAQYFDESDLMKIVFDLFFAGFDTTSNMLRWMILYAAKYPEVQKRVQGQIDQVVPKGEYPGYHHKAQLPLVEAYIHEVLRCASLVPFSVMRSTTHDVSVADYIIPKGTMVFSLTGLSHKDPRYWEEPQQFNIDRFLDVDGRFISHKEGFAPFGTGRRSCLGESLARMELSIFTATLLQNFDFSTPEGRTIDLSPDKVPFLNICKKQEFVMKTRQ